MKLTAEPYFQLLAEQQAIQNSRLHPSQDFVKFPRDDFDESIPAGFATVARRYPDRLAVKAGDRELTYAELDQAADRIALKICSMTGFDAASVLMLCEHGADAIVAALAILKAGKVLVAADPLFPAERIMFMAEDSRAGAILTTTAHLGLASKFGTARRPVLNIDRDEAVAYATTTNVPLSGTSPAQIVYTSGSTGKPKGVIRTHGRMVHSASILIDAFHISPADRLLTLYTLSFGAGLTEILKGLLTGAALFPYDAKKRELANLARFLKQHEITCFASSPSTFRCFINEIEPANVFSSVRLVELGSEPLARREVEMFRTHFAEHTVLVNRLASSETGTVCMYFIGPQMQIDSPVVPVGYAVNGKEILILNQAGNLAEPNQVGEIAVRSRYLSSGYWRNDELTSEKFKIDPANTDSSLYLTGDLGRMMADGCLIYLGRKDDQVKIRGFRVQTGEIQAVILEHTGVKDAAVVAWEREVGETSLVGYVVPRDDLEFNLLELKRALRTKLPDYMVPATLLILDALPLTNGKLDRQALPPPEHNRPILGQLYAAPRSVTEKRLAEIWQEVLTVRDVGIDDNFFDLGGHSLAASRIVARVTKTFQLEVPLKALFDAPTVAQMAAIIEQSQGSRDSAEALGQMLSEVEAMTDEEVWGHLAERNTAPKSGNRHE